MQDDAWVQIARAGPHNQTTKGTETHRGVDAAAMPDRRHRCTIAQVGDDNTVLRNLAPVPADQLAHDIFVRQPMETIPPDSLFGQGPGQTGDLCKPRQAMVKSGIETGDLRQVGA